MPLRFRGIRRHKGSATLLPTYYCLLLFPTSFLSPRERRQALEHLADDYFRDQGAAAIAPSADAFRFAGRGSYGIFIE